MRRAESTERRRFAWQQAESKHAREEASVRMANERLEAEGVLRANKPKAKAENEGKIEVRRDEMFHVKHLFS